MNQDKWKNTKILAALEGEIKELIEKGKYSSVMDFVNEAVREKLRYEKFKKTGYIVTGLGTSPQIDVDSASGTPPGFTLVKDSEKEISS